MREFSAHVAFDKIDRYFVFNAQSTAKVISSLQLSRKLDLCERGNFSPTIFNSDVELISVSPISCFYLFVRLSLCRWQRMPKIRTLFCLVVIKRRSFLTSSVFWFVFLNASSHLCFYFYFLILVIMSCFFAVLLIVESVDSFYLPKL